MEVSVDLGRLQQFLRSARTAHDDLTTWMNTAVNTIRDHASQKGSGVDAGVTGPLSTLITEHQELIEFVQLVHDAAEAADGKRVGTVVTLDSAALMAALGAAAQSRSIDLDTLLGIDPVATNQFKDVGTVPPSSGFVNDPVATATAALIVAVEDFVVPPRLEVLASRRTYASVSSHIGAFGRGWWWWSDVNLSAPNGFGWRTLTLDDGRVAELVPGADPGQWTHLGHDLYLTSTTSGATLRWGRFSSRPYQTWTFSDGTLRTVSGPTIGATELLYDADGRLTRLAHSGGSSIGVRWRGDRVAELSDRHGRRATFEYDEHDDLIAATNGDGRVRYELDDRARIVRIIDADDVIVETMTYDDADRVLTQTSATGRVTTFARQAALTTVVGDVDGRTLSRYVHDEFGRVTTTTSVDGFSLTRRFDERGRIVAQYDGSGDGFLVTVSTADDGAVVESTQFTDGRRSVRSFDGLERLTSISELPATDPDGGDQAAGNPPAREQATTTRFEYPDQATVATDRVLASRVVAGDGSVTSLGWRDGLVTSITDADGVTVTLEHDGDGVPTAITDAAGARTEFVAGPSGAWTEARYADGSIARRRFDHGGRLLTTTNPDDATVTIEYSAAGRIRAVTDALGATTTFRLGPDGMCHQVVAADGAVTTVEHDADQHLVAVIGPDGQAIRLGVDEWGRARSVSVDGLGTWTRHDDPSGTSATIRNPRGDVSSTVVTATVLSRDAHGRATAQRAGTWWSETTWSPAGRVLEHRHPGGSRQQRYDRLGNLTGVDIGTGWWTIDVDPLGRPVTVTSPAGRRRTVQYTPGGKVARLTLGTMGWTYAYDLNGRVTSVADDSGRQINFAYDPCGRVERSTEMSGATTTFEYNRGGRLQATVDAEGGRRTWTVTDRRHVQRTDELGRTTTIALDACGRPESVTMADGRVVAGPGTDSAAGLGFRLAEPEEPDQHDPDGLLIRRSGHGVVTIYERDPLTGLVSAIVTESAERRQVSRLLRDEAGRIVTRFDDGQVTTFEYDAGGRLSAMHGNDVRHTWEYDIVGRLTAEHSDAGATTYHYDAAGQLREQREPSGVTTFEYDADGRRISAHGHRPATYEWSDWRLTAFTHDGRRHAIADGLFGLPLAVDEVELTWQRAAEPARCLSVAPTATSGPWGEPIVDELAGHPFGGVSIDGLVLLGARPYHPATRQFLSRDPLEPIVGETSANWRYSYASCDPVNRLDLFGLQGSPLSIEEFDRLRSQYTGPQWGNIAAAALTVVAVAVAVGTLGTAGPFVLAAYGAFTAGAIEATKQGVNVATNKGSAEWDPIAIARSAAIGGLTGPIAKIPGVGKIAERGAFFAAGVDVVGNAGGEAINQLYDLTDLPGSDHSYDFDSILIAGGTAAGGHLVSHGVSAIHSAVGGGSTHVTTGGGPDPVTGMPDPGAGATPSNPAPGGTGHPVDPAGVTQTPSTPSNPASAAGNGASTPAQPRYVMSKNGIIHERGVSPYYERTAAVVNPGEIRAESLSEITDQAPTARVYTPK